MGMPPWTRHRHTMGRPRVTGPKRASLPEGVEHMVKRNRFTVAWYGGASRNSEVVMGTGHWYRSGEALVEVRWVSIQDGTRTHRDGYAMTTDLTMKPPQIGEYDTQRWSIDTTCQECREDLTLESTKGDG